MSILLARLVLLKGLLEGFALGALFDSIEMVSPEALVHFDPIVHGFEFSGVESIQAASAAPAHRDEPDAAEDAQVLGDRRLREAEGLDQIFHGPFAAAGEQLDDPAAPGLGDGV